MVNLFFIGGLKYNLALYQAYGMLPKREEPDNRNKFSVRIPVWIILKIQTALMALAAKNDSIMCSAFYPKFGPWYFDNALAKFSFVLGLFLTFGFIWSLKGLSILCAVF